MDSTVAARLAALSAAIEGVRGLPWGSLSAADLLQVCAGVQDVRNVVPVVEHAAIAALAEQTTPAVIGAKSWPEVMRIRLRISGDEARRRFRDAINLGPRTSVTGEVLAPRRAATAAAQAGGWVTPDHVEELEKFFTKCPDWVDQQRRERFEEKLVAVAARETPETLGQTVNEALYLLDQDGDKPIDVPVERKRGLTFHPQQPDGLSKVSGWVTPEFRATWEPARAKYAAPGMCNPDDETPCISGVPSEEAIQADTRSIPQRTHDAFLAVGRHALMSGELGQHNGLPVSIIVTTTLQELEAGAGIAVTAGGSKLPIPDVIKLAAHAWHYLAVFDAASNVPLYFGRTKRIATPGQRLLLFARDRGCTRPGCTAGGYQCQAHHADTDFAKGGLTDITELALGCGPDQRLVGPGKWTTRITHNGRCEWIPPPLLDIGQSRINNYHHPQTYLTEPNKDDGETDCQPT
ncbi:HNH endonuclease signature motif containing protein [Mycolicibacterium sp. XJ870]